MSASYDGEEIDPGTVTLYCYKCGNAEYGSVWDSWNTLEDIEADMTLCPNCKEWVQPQVW